MADAKHFALPASEIANISIGVALRGRSPERAEVISIIGLDLTSRQAYAPKGKMIAPFCGLLLRKTAVHMSLLKRKKHIEYRCFLL